MDFVEFTVNGKKCKVDNKLPRDTTLNAFLRYQLGLPGTKVMCHQGGCGACIVDVVAPRQPTGEVETFSVNSCLVLIFSCHGWDITTIEGVGNRKTGYSEVQKRITAFNGSQCGYCTPGWVMQMTSLLDKHLTMAELETSFGSNTCRCTGYRPILDTMKSFGIDASPKLCARVADIEDVPVCKKKSNNCKAKLSNSSNDTDWIVLNNPQESTAIELDFGNTKFHKVFDVEDIFEILDREGYDSYMLVDGNTGKGILENFEYPRILIDISDIKSLKEYTIDQNLVIGANVVLQDALELFKNLSSNNVDFSYLAEFAKHFEEIAHLAVRKIGSIAGNLMVKHLMPSFQSDVFLLLSSVGATLSVRDHAGNITVLTMPDFLSHDMSGKLILKLELPPLSNSYTFRSYKILPRSQNALAIVNAAFLLKMDPKTKVISEANIAFGNITPEFVYATNTEAFLKGKCIFNNKTLQEAIKVLAAEIVPQSDPPKPSPACRKKLALGIFYKFILNICPSGLVSQHLRSGGFLIQRPLSHGTQDYETDPKLYPLNKPIHKLEAQIQSAGEARYVNDIPPLPREVFGAFVLSTVHCGQVESIDVESALAIKGVVALYTAKDIPGKNSFSVPGVQLQTEDEEILVSDAIKFYGQPVAIVVATSEDLAAKVANKVKVTYKNVCTSPPVLTIDQAKKDSKRLLPSDESIKPKGKGTDVKKVVKGVYEIEAQYHYYLEPLSCVVVPVDNALDVYDSTQWIDLSQIAIAKALDIHESDINIKVRRIGGGFGGKISRNVQVATACALVAKKLDTPCRFILPLPTNLTIAGKRLPCQTEYEAGVDEIGRIQYLNASIVEDKGYSVNEDILSYTVGGFPNCYDTDYWSVKSANVLTDLPTNTFMRAPGTCEGISSIEHILEHIAFEVQKDPTDVRLANMRTDDNDLPELIENYKKIADYDKRLSDIREFNKANRWMKKGMRISVMSFPVEFYGNYSAFVSVYRGDGTVTVTTGGIEMGQGINTKAAQVCAYSLGIPVETVSILPNYSFTAANNVFSGSSITSESVCYAIIKACDIIKSRLEPIKKKMGDVSWLEIVKEAGSEEIDLTANFMMTDTEPDLENYNAYAVAILETQLDVLTGRYQILRADILEDVGLSTNPQVDVGQVEGAYVQGLGYFTTEKLVYDKNTGQLLTNNALNYLVPKALDIPADFRIRLRYNSKNPKGVLSSKAVGEMGICTAHGITHVLRQCIYESRADSGYDPTLWINIDIPYDTESILKALDVKLEEFVICESDS